MAFIHQLADWPALEWDDQALSDTLAAVRYKQGRHLGRMESLGLELRAEASVTALTREVVRSSAIEGEQLSPREVRSSIARQLGMETAGLPTPGRQIEGIVEMMLDATRHCEQPLTAERLFMWHAALFPSGRSGLYRITVGAWRTGEADPMQVVSGSVGRERIHFEAPDATRLTNEMDQFLDWFNGRVRIDPVIKAAVAHFWFVTIHPFADGNGRIARAIAEMALARADGSKERYYSMSDCIEAERKAYYLQLEAAQRGSLDITAWISWFLGCLDRALDAADAMLEDVTRKASFWRRMQRDSINDRQRKVIDRLLEGWAGTLSTARYARFVRCSTDTAYRDIQDLVGRGILIRNEAGGRSTSYRLADSGGR